VIAEHCMVFAIDKRSEFALDEAICWRNWKISELADPLNVGGNHVKLSRPAISYMSRCSSHLGQSKPNESSSKLGKQNPSYIGAI